MKKFEEYKQEYPELADNIYSMQHRKLPEGWDRDLPEFPADPKGIASRASSGKVLNAIANNVPWLMGGSADLAPSTKTTITSEDAGAFSMEYMKGRNFHFGIREHAMGSIINGLSLRRPEERPKPAVTIETSSPFIYTRRSNSRYSPVHIESGGNGK